MPNIFFSFLIALERYPLRETFSPCPPQLSNAYQLHRRDLRSSSKIDIEDEIGGPTDTIKICGAGSKLHVVDSIIIVRQFILVVGARVFPLDGLGARHAPQNRRGNLVFEFELVIHARGVDEKRHAAESDLEFARRGPPVRREVYQALCDLEGFEVDGFLADGLYGLPELDVIRVDDLKRVFENRYAEVVGLAVPMDCEDIVAWWIRVAVYAKLPRRDTRITDCSGMRLQQPVLSAHSV